jgi:alpha-galactosidase
MPTYHLARFSSILGILNMNSFLMEYVDFWGHSDADMLEVGNAGLTQAETRTHFAFWAAMKSPLIIGTDLSKLSQQNIDILQNKYLLAFNQDPIFGAPAKPYKWGTNENWTFNATNPAEYWSGKSRNGTMVLLFNPYGATRNMTADFNEIPGIQSKARHEVIDVWTGQVLGWFRGGVEVNVTSHDTAVLLIKSK